MSGAQPDIGALPGAYAGSGRRLIKRGKWLLYWSHRWLGVVTCLLCVMWFLSGLVMLYVPFPSWSNEERLAALPPIAVGRVATTPDDALAAAKVTSYPLSFRLEMLVDEPVYRIVANGKPASISAVTGQAIGEVGAEQAKRHEIGRAHV